MFSKVTAKETCISKAVHNPWKTQQVSNAQWISAVDYDLTVFIPYNIIVSIVQWGVASFFGKLYGYFKIHVLHIKSNFLNSKRTQKLIVEIKSQYTNIANSLLSPKRYSRRAISTEMNNTLSALQTHDISHPTVPIPSYQCRNKRQ